MLEEPSRALPPPTAAHLMVLEERLQGQLQEPLPEISAEAGENLPATRLGESAQRLVYVIFTSGSTGRPKGTAMAHRSMVNLVEWHRRSFPAGAGQRVLQFAALSFDVAFQETFTTLCTGGTLVLLPEWVRRDPRALLELLSRRSIQRLFVPPLLLQSLAEQARASDAVPGSLTDVITAGEQLRISPDIVAFFERLPGCRLHNHYGPTETHVVTALTLTGAAGGWPALPSIGRPVSNTQIHVLDAGGQPAPLAVAGEIYIGGVAVARGYLGQPQLTAQRFVGDPFSCEPGARLYRTGDLGRWCADGTLEYLGRNDTQVKIRGYRIELGEIETQLARHERVREAVVVVQQQAPGLQRLVGYVTARAGGTSLPHASSRDDIRSEPLAAQLHEYLQGLLPEYMVPSAFVVLPSLPLTPNGKLDRRALPAPELEAYRVREYAPPQGDTEQLLASLWQQLLHVQRIGRYDNFFELGGHSLIAMQVLMRIRASFSIDLPMRSLFEFAILHRLAEHVESLRQSQMLATLAAADGEMEGWLQSVASMPESEARELIRRMQMEDAL
jgi:amino acid adenylation domain-containing protein